MTFDEYRELAMTTAIYPDKGRGTHLSISYTILGLNGEAGELANKFKKVLRGDRNPDYKAQIKDELGDVLWYCAAIAYEFGFSLDDVANSNVQKLLKRYKNNTIKGEGDKR